jgi:hypothetical protein
MTPSTTREVRDRDDVILAHLKEAGLGDFFKGGDPK